MLRYALEHLDPSVTASDLPEDILVLAAKNGHLSTLRLLNTHCGGDIPLRAYQKAFSWGKTNVCKYIVERFPE